jgi:MFS family permease
MLQRIQSIFLLLAALAMVVACFFPLWIRIEGEVQTSLSALYWLEERVVEGKVVETLKAQSTIYLLVIGIGSALFALYVIFAYQNRTRQMFLVVINSLLIMTFGGIAIYHTYPYDNGSYAIGFFAVIIALITNQAARIFISRDEKMVRSADRLR